MPQYQLFNTLYGLFDQVQYTNRSRKSFDNSTVLEEWVMFYIRLVLLGAVGFKFTSLLTAVFKRDHCRRFAVLTNLLVVIIHYWRTVTIGLIK